MINFKNKYYLLSFLTFILFSETVFAQQAENSVITTAKLLTTQKVDLTQVEIKEDSFIDKKGLHGVIIIPLAIPEEKKIHFTLLNEAENIVWKSYLKWEKPIEKQQEFVFSKKSFSELSGQFDLKIEVKNKQNKLLAMSATKVEITNIIDTLETLIKKESQVTLQKENILMKLKLRTRKRISQASLKIEFYQDFLEPNSKIQEKYIYLGNIPAGIMQKEIEIQKPTQDGFYIITAQVVDRFKVAKSGIKMWEKFFSGIFFNFEYLNTYLFAEDSVTFLLEAEGTTNSENPSFIVRNQQELKTRRPLSIQENDMFRIKQSFPLPNQENYEIIVKIKEGEKLLNTKIINIKNPAFKRIKRKNYLKNITNILLHNNDQQETMQIPTQKIVQLLLITSFLILSYLLFKQNKRF